MHCVRDCQHPWFGGNGACVLGADNTPACVCGPAFSVVDILGQPACESKAVRTVCHFGKCVKTMYVSMDLIPWRLATSQHVGRSIMMHLCPITLSESHPLARVVFLHRKKKTVDIFQFRRRRHHRVGGLSNKHLITSARLLYILIASVSKVATVVVNLRATKSTYTQRIIQQDETKPAS